MPLPKQTQLRAPSVRVLQSNADTAIPGISRIQEDDACLIKGRPDVAYRAQTGIRGAALEVLDRNP